MNHLTADDWWRLIAVALPVAGIVVAWALKKSEKLSDGIRQIAQAGWSTFTFVLVGGAIWFFPADGGDRHVVNRPAFDFKHPAGPTAYGQEVFTGAYPPIESLNQVRVSGNWVDNGDGKLHWVPDSVEFELLSEEGSWKNVDDSTWKFAPKP